MKSLRELLIAILEHYCSCPIKEDLEDSVHFAPYTEAPAFSCDELPPKDYNSQEE